MKKLGFLFAGLFIMALATQQVKAQDGNGNSATETADVKATIIAPISIEKTADLQFGKIVRSTESGRVIIPAAENPTPIYQGVVAFTTPGAVTAAQFTVTGEEGYTYAITLPDEVTLTSEGEGTMIVTNFTSTPSEEGLLTEGTQDLLVGATLTVEADQPSGEYVGEFEVTVAYN